MLSLKTLHVYALSAANLMVLAADFLEVVVNAFSAVLGG